MVHMTEVGLWGLSSFEAGDGGTANAAVLVSEAGGMVAR
jgi:hypothetical protein